MDAYIDSPHLTVFFMATVAGLATALVVMFYELERSPQTQRVRARLGRLVDHTARSRESRPKRDES